MRHSFIILASLCMFALIGCEHARHNRGNVISEQDLAALRVGITDKADVLTTIGSPTVRPPLDSETWIYIGGQTEGQTFDHDRVLDYQIVTLQFDDMGTLAELDIQTEAPKEDVDMLARKTPSSGSQLNAFQQFIGNIGKFNTSGQPTQ